MQYRPTVASIIELRKLVGKDHVGACATGDRACVLRIGPARSRSRYEEQRGGTRRDVQRRVNGRSRQAGRQDLGKATAGRSFY